MNKNSISRQLYLARIAADLTQGEIAKLTNLSIPTICNIENDHKIQQVSLGNIQKYCNEVGLQISLMEAEKEEK